MPTATLGILSLGGLALTKSLATPSRPYTSNCSVADSYDSWTADGVLEHYWGDHIHLGYYHNTSEPDAPTLARLLSYRSFITAKKEFIKELLRVSNLQPCDDKLKILDVGCGVGGTARFMAASFPQALVKGISISPKQVQRARELTSTTDQVEFEVVDAQSMASIEGDNKYDIIYCIEATEHMPQKREFIEHMMRCLKPGGKFVLAAWCTRNRPLSPREQREVRFLEEEWSHPHFWRVAQYEDCLKESGAGDVHTADWTQQTLPSWLHSIAVGLRSPWFIIMKWDVRLWWKCVREASTLLKMRRAFGAGGTMKYGIFWGEKKELKTFVV
jgi:MPBQ/MSBQ methyltransferase